MRADLSDLTRTDNPIWMLFGPWFRHLDVRISDLDESFSGECWLDCSGLRTSPTSGRFLALDSQAELSKWLRWRINVSSEFLRLCRIIPEKFLASLPHEMKPVPGCDFTELFLNSFIPSGLIELCKESILSIINKKGSVKALSAFLRGLISHYFIETTGPTKSDWKPPSNPRIHTVVTWLTAIRLWESIETRDVSLFFNVFKSAQESVTFKWNIIQVPGTSRNTIYWSFNKMGMRSKTCGIPNNPNLISRIISSLTLITKQHNRPYPSNDPSPRFVSKALSSFNKGLDVTHLRYHTGYDFPYDTIETVKDHIGSCPVNRRAERSQRESEIFHNVPDPESAIVV